ncbi:MAG: hypothetical protein A2V86_01770 [Deltaproteobacteria bacterium RBG_16_49_23]|nr:MAG: hypothetical protein A2V86_01770 [Deltaproteobacteria bacterium RBG_16_49_23]
MPFLVCMGATTQCSFGVAPSSLIVLPQNRPMVPTPAANIMDYAPLVNIMPFGACSSIANPQVASATSAALGVLTPMPCIPVTVAPWAPGSPVFLIGGMPALNDASMLMCTWGGVIRIINAGQITIQIP